MNNYQNNSTQTKSSLAFIGIFLYLIPMVSLFTSCHKNTIDTNMLLGEWEFIQPESKEDEYGITTTYLRSDFKIMKDSLYEENNGFYQNQPLPNNEHYSIYLGQKGKYYITDDSLFVKSIKGKEYFAQKIVKVSKDYLTLYDKDSKLNFQYKRKPVVKPSDIPIDQITLSLAPCFGTCPISSISLDSEGNVYYYGISDTKLEGLYQGKADKIIFTEMVKKLNEIRFLELENNYSQKNVTDLPGLSVSFISNNKIIKSIDDYGYAQPKELKGILNMLIYAWQSANLKKYEYNLPIFLYGFQPDISMNTSDSFYIQSLLFKAKQSDKEFTSKYRTTAQLILPENFDYEKLDSMDRSISTDGQYFKIQKENKDFVTLDIGFDVISTNKKLFDLHKN